MSETERPEKKELRTRYQVSPLGALRALLRNYFFAAVGAAVLALFLRVYVIEAFRIPTDFMAPTLLAGDHIFVNKVAFRSGKIKERGDVTVFSLVNDPAKDYIKRVIALEGDKIEIRDGQVLINGQSISKPIDADNFEETLGKHRYRVTWEGIPAESRKMMPLTVPAGQVFVLGDNRAKGQDSRGWGFLPATQLKGRASFIWFSNDKGQGKGVRWARVFKGVD